MSGNFSQRGEPAILDKWNRAEMALKNGVDLVIELPFYYSCNGSSIFANGAMKTLSFIGCVNNICFGIEGKAYEKIIEVSNLLKEDCLSLWSAVIISSASKLLIRFTDCVDMIT